MKTGAFAILGAGRLGRALGRLLVGRGFEARGLSCRRIRSARQAAAFIGEGRPTTSNVEAAADAPLVLIATPDGAIAAVARELAAARLRWAGRIVAHTSGAISSQALSPLAELGARTASFHPLASIADPGAGLDNLKDVPFAIEGDPKAARALKALVLALGGTPFTIPPQAKALYHFVACLLSNDLVALLSFGLDAAGHLGLSRREVARLYLPLVRGTVENVARLGPVRALTGPVSRGDASTLRLHGEALRTLPSALRKVHRLLALRATALALEARTITPDVAARLSRLLNAIP